MGNVMQDVLNQGVLNVAALKGTFIEELFEAMRNGHAHDDMEPVNPGEKVVGEMNEMEKALNFLRHKYREAEKKIIGCLNGESDLYSHKEKTRLIDKLVSCRSRFQVAEKLMWENIETRIAAQKSERNNPIGIRADHQIVIMFDGNEHSPLGEIIALREALTLRDILPLALLKNMMRD
ncbi:MAG: hypothetical protein Q8Q23_05475 [bacterium]|nr:hypothetical protein [bacterium]